MLTLTDKTKCCGCGACANSCPKNCIAMVADEEGFLSPQVDKSACVNCGLCEKVCPILNKPQTFPVLETYAAKHKNAEVKLKSSSGGMFTALAEVILKEGGVVFGAGFDKEWNVVHTYAENLTDLDKLRRSKYVQSDTENTYQQAKQFLEQGRKVLFTGTPCQIAGLRNYLGKEYENLLTAQLICHGTPSPGVWSAFLKENFNKNDIKNINFRDKHFGWSANYLSFLFSDGLLCAHGMRRTLAEKLFERVPGKRKIGYIYRNVFLRAFLAELISRRSCFVCAFRGKENQFADFTMGDLWGKWPEIITSQDKREGMSVLTANTAKAKHLLNSLSLVTQPIDFDRVARINFPLLSSPVAHPKRAEFFARYRTENVSKLIRELLDIKPWWLAIINKGYNKVLTLLKIKRP